MTMVQRILRGILTRSSRTRFELFHCVQPVQVIIYDRSRTNVEASHVVDEPAGPNLDVMGLLPYTGKWNGLVAKFWSVPQDSGSSDNIWCMWNGVDKISSYLPPSGPATPIQPAPVWTSLVMLFGYSKRPPLLLTVWLLSHFANL